MVSIVQATLLEEQQVGSVRAFLERDVSANLFGLNVLERWGITGLLGTEWWGVFRTPNEIVAVCYAGDHDANAGFGLVVPAGPKRACEQLGMALRDRGGAALVVGERRACDAVWLGMGGSNPRLCSDQLLLEATDVPNGTMLDLRRGHDEDFPWLHAAASAMTHEDLGLRWGGQDEEAFSARLWSGIRSGSEYIGLRNGQLLYRAKRSTMGRYGAQIEGVWVEPAFRGRGVGTAGTRAVTAALLCDGPRVTLHVREDNHVALQCYSSVGFQSIRDFRLLVR